MCLFVYYTCLLFVYSGCAGSVGIFWRAGSYIFCVCDSAVWSAGPVQFYSWTYFKRMAGLYKFFFFSGSVVAGTVRLKWWGGMVRISSCFLQFAVSSLGGWMSVVGFCFSAMSIFFGNLVVFSRGFVFCKLLIFLNLLQVVQAE